MAEGCNPAGLLVYDTPSAPAPVEIVVGGDVGEHPRVAELVKTPVRAPEMQVRFLPLGTKQTRGAK